jgi:uncharacterized integral membrane protein
MQIFIIIALVIALVAVLFALQNLTVVTVTFFIWNTHASLALVLLVTLAVGVLISLLASLPGLIHGKWTTSGQKKKLAVLENERNAYRQKAEESENEVKVLEEQVASLSAELEKHQPDPVSPTPSGS